MDLIKRVLSATPLIWPFRPNGLYVFNYHRIGEASKTEYDPNVFSCTQERFDEHLSFYKRNFTVLSEPELLALLASDKAYNDKFALITFDDGYIDNYELAFPTLLKHQLSATFFIATDFISKQEVPWWDEVAFIIKEINPGSINLFNGQIDIDLSNLSLAKKIREVLKGLKQAPSYSMQEKLKALRENLEFATDISNASPLFMNWKQMSEMQNKGMFFGSQTCSHQILSHLSADAQRRELNESKSTLESIFEREINSLAYPVGGATAYNETTMSLAEKAGYKVAFNFVGGINEDASEKYQVMRFPVDNNANVKQLEKQINQIILK